MYRWLIVLMLLAGCSSPNIYVEDGSVIGIEIDGKEISTDVEALKSDRVSLDGVWVKRTVYETSKQEILVYEVARTQSPYMFQYEVVRSLQIIFDAKNVERVDRIGNLGFYVVVPKAGERFFAVAQNINKQGIDMVYGLSEVQMNTLMANLGGKKRMTQHVVALTPEHAIRSLWNPKMTIMDGLLEVQGGRPHIR